MLSNKPDIVSVIENEIIDLKNYKSLCPFHSEKNPSFIVSPKKQIAHCFGCGWHGDVISFIQKYKNLSFQEALTYLGINDKPYKLNLKETKRRELLKKFREWCDSYHDDLRSLIRCLWKAKQTCKDIAEAEKLSEFYHKESAWLYQIEILQSNDDMKKYELYREAMKNE